MAVFVGENFGRIDFEPETPPIAGHRGQGHLGFIEKEGCLHRVSFIGNSQGPAIGYGPSVMDHIGIPCRHYAASHVADDGMPLHVHGLSLLDDGPFLWVGIPGNGLRRNKGTGGQQCRQQDGDKFLHRRAPYIGYRESGFPSS